jgi:YD repeat-containing protein
MSGVATAVVAGSVLTAGAGYMASQSAADASKEAANASRQLSEQQYQRAQEAAGRVPEFRPVTVTSSFGTPQYTYDESGRLTGVSSTPSSWLYPLQTRGQGLAGGYLNLQEQALSNPAGYNVANQAFGAAQNLYGQAAGALPTSYDTTQATQDYYTQMKGLLAADQERQLAATRNSVFQKGRQGLAMGATQAGGELATNPEMAAYYNALAKSDANLALDAKSRAISDLQARQTMGLGLLTAGGQQSAIGGNALNQYYGNITAAQSPFSGQMGQLSSLESMINQPVGLGMQYGGLTTTQANAIADAYIRASGAGGAAAQQAIGYDLQANSQNPWASLVGGAGSGLQNWGAMQSANARNDKLISALGTRA